MGSYIQKSKEDSINYEENDNPLDLQMDTFLFTIKTFGFGICILNRILIKLVVWTKG